MIKIVFTHETSLNSQVTCLRVKHVFIADLLSSGGVQHIYIGALTMEDPKGRNWYNHD